MFELAMICKQTPTIDFSFHFTFTDKILGKVEVSLAQLVPSSTLAQLVPSRIFPAYLNKLIS